MAQPLICQTCEEEPAVMVMTLAEDGTTMLVGASCLPATAVGLVEALTGLRLVPTPDQLAAEGSGQVVTDTPPDPEPAPAPKSRNDKGPAAVEDAQPSEAESTAAADG